MRKSALRNALVATLAIAGPLYLSGCAGMAKNLTSDYSRTGATKDQTYESTKAAFERVEIGMTAEALESLDFGPNSPGITRVNYPRAIGYFVFRPDEKISYLPAELFDKCIKIILEGDGGKECSGLFIERSWKESFLASDIPRAALGVYEVREGMMQSFSAIIILDMEGVVIRKATIDAKGNVPTYERKQDYLKPLKKVSPFMLYGLFFP